MRLVIMLLILLALPVTSYSATINIPKDYPTIQQGIDMAIQGDTVLVGPGVYVENINFKGKGVIVKSSHGAEATTIDGNQTFSVATFNSNEGPDSVLDGFTLTNGGGTYFEPYPKHYGFCGSAVFCNASSPTIRNNAIKDNPAIGPYNMGGGIYCFKSSMTIQNNLISNNTAHMGGGIFCMDSNSSILKNTIQDNSVLTYYGGGLYGIRSDLAIEDNVIKNNSSSNIGGGLCFVDSCTVSIKNNLIYENTAGSHGGGICGVVNCNLSLTNCMIFGNLAQDQGGGVCVGSYTVTSMTNCTVVGNSSQLRGGGFCGRYNDSSSIHNSIFWDNHAPKGPEISVEDKYYPSSLLISHCDVKGGKASVFVDSGCALNWGKGMIDANPGLIDYHLTHPSPCRDAGDAAKISEPFDFEGDPRVVNNLVDMGADEFHTHLYYSGELALGQSFNLNFIQTPNTSPVVLWMGSGVLSNPISLPPYGLWRLEFPILLEAQLGAIPNPSGVLTLKCHIPINLPAPLDLPLQSLIGSQLTNLCVLRIR